MAQQRVKPHEFIVFLAGRFLITVGDDLRIYRLHARLDALFCWFQGACLCDSLYSCQDLVRFVSTEENRTTVIVNNDTFNHHVRFNWLCPNQKPSDISLSFTPCFITPTALFLEHQETNAGSWQLPCLNFEEA